MISTELEENFHAMLARARQDRHESISVEHLLLALLDESSANEVLRACGADVEVLRTALSAHIKEKNPQTAGIRVELTPEFDRVFTRTIARASAGIQDLKGSDILLSLFDEEISHAVYLLRQQGVTRHDIAEKIKQHR